jgi:short-subunit dehydrogenase
MASTSSWSPAAGPSWRSSRRSSRSGTASPRTCCIKDLALRGAAAEITDDLARRGVVIDALVNNAGFGLSGRFAEQDEREITDLVQVNMAALTELTRRFLPGMVERRRGRILNLASIAAFVPGPLMAVYYASKAYVLSLSVALSEELRGTGVTVTALCPGPVDTGFPTRANTLDSRLFARGNVPGPVEVADIGYDAMMKGKAVVVEGGRNRLFAFGSRFVPISTAARIAGKAQEPPSR